MFMHAQRLDRQDHRAAVALPDLQGRFHVLRQVHVVARPGDQPLGFDGFQETAGRTR